MKRTRQTILEERRRLKAEYRWLYDELLALLYRHDPIDLAGCGVPQDEYAPEVGTILPRLRDCRSPDDVRKVAHEEFARWFSAEIAGPEEAYTKIASDIWDHWQRFNAP